jgi:UDP:flavonoid glycosyltransferase YjiC (YdhE family)
MRAALVTWDGGSNVQPFEVLGAALCARGEDVAVLSNEVHRPLFQAMGATFAAQPVGDKTHHGRPSEAEIRRRVAELWLSPVVASAVHDLLTTRTFDVALVDVSLLNAASACEAASTPMIVVHHSLPQTLRIARRAGMQAALAPINELRASFGLTMLSDVEQLQRHALAEIAPTFAALDDELQWNVPLHYVGPLQAARAPVPVDDLPDRFVLVSFSTTWQSQVDALNRVVAALADLDEAVVLTVGPALEPSEISAASNTIVLGNVPHTQLLDRVDLVVTHAGHGTTVTALAAGVPLVCMPMGRDQFDIARRVEAVGAGVHIDVHSPPEVVVDAVRRVRDDPTFRQAALDIASSAGALAGCAGALAIIDSCC